MQLALTATAVEKSFGKGSARTPVLNSVDLEVLQGECVFLVGPSGCGKSTLLSILGCVLAADAGEVRVLGEDVRAFSPNEQAQFRRERLGFVFQRFHLFRGLRAWENVRVSLDLLGYHRSKAKAAACELLEAVGLEDKVNNTIAQLSLGQCQRVALARALAGDPDLILADEPTASLDATTGLAAMSLLRDMTKQRNKTCLVVTHDSRIFGMADRILKLEDGRIVAEER